MTAMAKAARARMDAAYRANAGWRHATDWSVAHYFGTDYHAWCVPASAGLRRGDSDPCPGEHRHCKRCESRLR
jgi:hypothetical protein